MKAFACSCCGQQLFFENTLCVACQEKLGFLPDALVLAAIRPTEDPPGVWRAAENPSGLYRLCRNYETENVCNWLVAADDAEPYCVSCRLNRTIPNLALDRNRRLWGKMEAAKRRLVCSLLQLGLPVFPKTQAGNGLAFEFLAELGPRVITGHRGGVITINLEEADDASRERIRQDVGESYRTLLGHFRHECGHYYWDLLVAGSPRIGHFRAVFGDERNDYDTALRDYYYRGAPADWSRGYVTPYAASHPWEDWAETWAHYMHIMDTLETAAANGLSIARTGDPRAMRDPFTAGFSDVREDWHELRLIMNSLNRSMGMADPYPFILSDGAAEKLAFIHDWVRFSL